MAQFENSPGVYTTEIDLTTTVPAVATSVGAFAGVFRWGPVDQKVLVDSETTLVSRFGAPTNHNPETFFTAANFLAYSNKLYVVRTANTSGNSSTIANSVVTAVAAANSAAVTNTVIVSSTVKNVDHFDSVTFDSTIYYAAKYPGALGNSLKVSVCDSANAYQSTVSLVPNSSINATASIISFTVGSNTATVTIVPAGSGTNATSLAVANTVASALTVGDYIKAGNTTTGIQYLKVTSVGAAVQAVDDATVTINLANAFNLAEDFTSNTFVRTWEYFGSVDRAPGTSVTQSLSSNATAIDELHVVVSDEDGLFSGVPGSVLEVFESVSRATDAKNESGRSLFYKSVINDTSNYVWAASSRTGAATAAAASVVNSTNTKPFTTSFIGGNDGLDENDVPLATIVTGFDHFTSPESVDISIILQGMAKGGQNGAGLANYVVGNIAETRKDCVVVLSPERADVVNALGNEVENLVQFRNSVTNSSYAILDSGYKYQYDKYNDVYRYIPLNGDIGGIIARTDDTNDSWWSPAGYTRGRVKNVVKLAYNPGQSARDILYKSDVNSVTSQPGQGPVLLGDKTLLGRPSAFNRINVRRLFIVLRKSISIAARDLLFDFNDEFTRAQFINIVDPYLRSVEARRGISAYRVKCDEDNNTPYVIDNNGFVGDIYVTPTRSINSINLNFIATRTGVEFEEIVGRF